MNLQTANEVKLAQEIQRLQAMNNELNEDLDLHDTIVATYKAEIEQLQAKNKKLKQILKLAKERRPLCFF